MRKIAVAAALTTMMAAASAQVYVGGNIGPSHVSADCSGTVSCDKSDTGYKLTVGYHLNPVAALEASYVDFGKLKVSAYDDFGRLIHGDIKADGVLLAAAFRHHATPAVSLVGRLGLAVLKSKVSARLGGASASEDHDSTKPYVGLGAEYALNKQLSLAAGADFTRVEIEGEGASVRLLSVGLQYAF